MRFETKKLSWILKISARYIEYRNIIKLVITIFGFISITLVLNKKVEKKRSKVANIKRCDGYCILTPISTLFIAYSIKNILNKYKKSTSIVIFGNKYEYNNKILYIVIAPQIWEELPKYYISFQLEQSINKRWFDEDYFNKLKNSICICDYSLDNIKFLQNNGFSYKRLFYVPINYFPNYIDFLRENDAIKSFHFDKEYDLLFYGDINNCRREKYLRELKRYFNIKILSNLYGRELFEYIIKSRIVVNIHYYDNALLESTRIYEALSLGACIVSESSADINKYGELLNIVKFVEVDDIEGMIVAIRKLLSDNEDIEKRISDAKNLLTDKNFSFNLSEMFISNNII